MKIRKLRISFMYLILVLCILSIDLDVLAVNKIKLIGHRGYSGKYTENTAKSVAGAYKKGFSGAEMDLYEAKDGTLWIFHDKSLMRMTGKKGSIYNLTKANRGKYRYKNGCKINTLEEILTKIKGKKNVYIHIKGNGKKSFLSEEAQERIAQDVEKYNLENQVVLFSSASKMKKIHIENVRLGWYSEEKDYTKLKQIINSMKEYNASELILLDYSQYKSKRRGKKLTSYAHKNSIKMGVYKCKTKKTVTIV